MRKLFIIILAILVVTGCKKETKIEKNLYKNGGEWNISEMEWKETYKYNTQDNYSETEYNLGTIKFNKDGTGESIIRDGNEVEREKFTYTNTENTLTIIDEDGDGMIFDLEWNKNEFTIFSKETSTYEDYDEDTFLPVQEVATFTTKMTCKKM